MTTPDSADRFVEALHQIVLHIQSEGSLPDLLQNVMEESKLLLDSDACSLFLYDEESNELYFEIVVGGDEQVRAVRLPVNHGIVGAAATDRRTLVVNDCAQDSRHQKIGDFEVRNLIACPMIRKDRLIGVIEFLNKHKGEDYDETDAKILEIIAEQAAAQIENTRLIKEKVTSERRAALGTTAAGLAHYIKNVLGQWKGSSQLIERGIKTKDIEMIEEMWPVLNRANDKIAKLVQDMLTISRERRPELQILELNALTREIAEDCASRAAKAGVEIAVVPDPALPPCRLDARQIHDVLLNLVVNAIDAIEEQLMENGRVELSVAYDPGRKWIRIVVEDNGPGMPPEIQQRVMEPFFSTKGSRGTGLGLAVAKKAMEEHGGDLTLSSQVGRGTRFTVEMPFNP
jgi:signal transduction histidine kinase